MDAPRRDAVSRAGQIRSAKVNKGQLGLHGWSECRSAQYCINDIAGCDRGLRTFLLINYMVAGNNN